MRKLILIAAFALASVSVQAGEHIDRVPAEIDAPAAAASPAAAPPATAEAAEPQSSKTQASRKQVSSKQASRKQVFSSRKAPGETNEQKARRIAAEYGISW